MVLGSKIKKTFKIILFGVATLLGMAIILPMIFQERIAKEIKVLANQNLDGKLNFEQAQLSFFTHFPSLTLSLTDFQLNGSQPFKNEKLIAASEIGFGINVSSLIFGKQTQINEIYLDNANINILVDKNGAANYNVYHATQKESKTEESSASLNLNSIIIANSALTYNDASAKILLLAKGLDYKGKGNLLSNDFKLKTQAEIESLSLVYDKKEYLKDKKVAANLITKINTESLAFIFEKNDLIINKLPVTFEGSFNFLSNGYAMDFDLRTENSPLEDLFTALPAEYIQWMNDTQMKGTTSASFKLKGNYIASENKNPEVCFKINVRNGFVQNKKAAQPIENIYLNLETKLPNLDTNLLEIKLDSLYFKLQKNQLAAIVKSTGLYERMTLDAKLKSKIDLKLVSQTLQIPDLKLQGFLDADIVSKGIYNKAKSQFPISKGYFNLTNGLIQTASYPHPIEKINVKAQLNCPTQNFKDAALLIEQANFEFEKEKFVAQASFKNFDDVIYDVQANGKINIGNMYQVFAQKGIQVNGFVNANLQLKGKQSDASNGNYNKLNNSGTLEVENMTTQSDYLPRPLLIKKGFFSFNQDKMYFKNFEGQYGQTDLAMQGYLENTINFILSENETIKGNFDFQSRLLNVNELIPSNNIDAEPSNEIVIVNPEVVVIPKNINLSLHATIKKTIYDNLNINNLKGDINIANGKLTLNNGSLELAGATAIMNANYTNEGTEKAYFEMDIAAQDFDIKRAYKEIELFRTIATAAEHAEGIVSLNYKLKGVLNNEMTPIMPSIIGEGTLAVKDVKMKGFKLLNAVAKKTENDAIKDPNITEVAINSKIKNNILTIDRFKFKVAGFRLRFEGESSLDGKLNLKMRVGLPPLGIIGIPIKVSGTQDNPIIKMGKQGKDLEETEYIDGVSPTNATPIDSLKNNTLQVK
jgi:AsmA protein